MISFLKKNKMLLAVVIVLMVSSLVFVFMKKKDTTEEFNKFSWAIGNSAPRTFQTDGSYVNNIAGYRAVYNQDYQGQYTEQKIKNQNEKGSKEIKVKNNGKYDGNTNDNSYKRLYYEEDEKTFIQHCADACNDLKDHCHAFVVDTANNTDNGKGYHKECWVKKWELKHKHDDKIKRDSNRTTYLKESELKGYY